MDEIMQDYYESWKFRHPYPEDVRTIFEKHTDKDLSWYFDGVFKTTDYLDFSIQKKRNRFIISNNGDLKTPVEVVFYGDKHKELERRWVEGFEWRTSLEAPANVWYAIIDPDEHMPDVDRSNNATRRETYFHWVWDQPTYYDNDINYFPWLFSYNYYNGFSPGVMFFKGGTPGYTSATSLLPMWDFKNQTLVGGISHKKKFEANGVFDKSSFLFKVNQLEGKSGADISYTGSFGEDESRSTFSTRINYSSLDSVAFDTSLYTSGSYPVAELKYDHDWQLKKPGNSFSLKSKMGFGEGFSTASVETKINLKLTKKIGTKVRVWAGGFLSNKNVPKHFRLYLSGGIDPLFSTTVFDRTGQSGMAVLSKQYIQRGPASRGLVTDENGLPLSSTGFTWGVNIDPSIPVFIDVAGGNDFKDTYTTIGLQFGPIIFPLYQSWEVEQKTAKDWNWIKDRMRITFSLEGIKIPGISN